MECIGVLHKKVEDIDVFLVERQQEKEEEDLKRKLTEK